MREYEVGFGKPPKKSRFKPGISGNPKGRPKRKPSALAGIIGSALSALIEYQERGNTKTTTRHQLNLKMLIERAIKGDLDAADLVLKVRAHGQRFGEVGVEKLLVSDWLPDRPGQTADQKTEEFANAGDADPLRWWDKSET
jgi:hypothetical protein